MPPSRQVAQGRSRSRALIIDATELARDVPQDTLRAFVTQFLRTTTEWPSVPFPPGARATKLGEWQKLLERHTCSDGFLAYHGRRQPYVCSW